MKLLTTLSFLAPLDASGIIAALVMIGAMIGLYIKQVKDIAEIKLTMKHDKNETDKELALLKLQIESQGKKDEEIIGILSDIKTTIAVSDERMANYLSREDKRQGQINN